MEVSITQFRRELFDLMNLAMKGEPVFVIHKGSRFRVVPEQPLGNRFSRITSLQVINPDSQSLDDGMLQEEMERGWQQDWAAL